MDHENVRNIRRFFVVKNIRIDARSGTQDRQNVDGLKISDSGQKGSDATLSAIEDGLVGSIKIVSTHPF